METINDEEYKTIINDPAVLIQFSATWCGPCKAMSRTLETVAQNNPDVKFCKVDIEVSPQATADNQVRAVPTIVYFKNGSASGRLVGAKSAEQLQDFINEQNNE